MPGLVPGIHALKRIGFKDVDARARPAHDGVRVSVVGVSCPARVNGAARKRGGPVGSAPARKRPAGYAFGVIQRGST